MLLFVLLVAFPPQTVSVTAVTGGTPTAGDQYTLQCDVSREETLSSSTLLELRWLTSANVSANTGDSAVSITGLIYTLDPTLTSTLTFTPLRTSLGDMYRCAVNMIIPGPCCV